MIKKVIMKNLICSNCAGKIEKALAQLPYINSASFNFPNQVMLIDATDEYDDDKAIGEIKEIVDSIEDGVDTYSYDKRHFIETKKRVENYNSFFIGIGLYIIGWLIFKFAPQIEFSTNSDIVGFLLHGNFNQDGVHIHHVIFYYSIPVYWIGYFFIAYKIFRKTLKGIKRGEIFNENLLMFIATFAAMLLGEFFEAILVLIFYTVGEYLQHRAVDKSKKEVSSLIDLKIEYANVKEDGVVVIKDPMSIRKGDILVVKHGEKIPVDGTIITGSTSLNTSALTGEAKLSHVKIGDYILSGNINVGSLIEIEASKSVSFFIYPTVALSPTFGMSVWMIALILSTFGITDEFKKESISVSDPGYAAFRPSSRLYMFRSFAPIESARTIKSCWEGGRYLCPSVTGFGFFCILSGLVSLRIPSMISKLFFCSSGVKDLNAALEAAFRNSVACGRSAVSVE